ncbi:RNA-binding protein [Mycoplasmopsis cynos]|uniref:RNA-binding protein n=1 Tax=Mycoplasmopsis cynos TaxID=171284 RepID=UPI00220E15CC|nr:RNA-binding protein [Mycoplasmopsis cynos]UWV77602.1 RNA-binding protein [Mycoplasmopsis cynos]
MIYKPGDVVMGKVIKIGSKYITVKTKKGCIFFINKNEITDFTKKSNYDIFRLNEQINFIALKFNATKRNGFGSYKKNHPNELKEKVLCKLIETPNGFKNLSEYSKLIFNSKTNDEATKEIDHNEQG